MAYHGEAPQDVGLYTAVSWQADRPAYYFFVTFTGVNKGTVTSPVECRHADKQARLEESGTNGVDLSFDDQTSAVALMGLGYRWTQLSVLPDVFCGPGDFPVTFTIGYTPGTTPNGTAFAAIMLHTMLQTSAVADGRGHMTFYTAAAANIVGALAGSLAPYPFQGDEELATPVPAAHEEQNAPSPPRKTSASAAEEISGPQIGAPGLGERVQRPLLAPQEHSAGSPQQDTLDSADEAIASASSSPADLGDRHKRRSSSLAAEPGSKSSDEEHWVACHWHLPSDLLLELGYGAQASQATTEMICFHI